LLTLPQVADELVCSVATIKRRVRSGALPVFVDGRLVRVREADLARYIAERVSRRTGAGVAAEPTGRILPPGSRLWD
jgi:excisionase family DNA binding protein